MGWDHMLSTRRVGIAAAIGLLALWPVSGNAQATGSPTPCRVLIQFYNGGSPDMPGIVTDSRYGARLHLEDGTPIVIPANRDGYVGFYAMPDTTIPVTWVRLYFSAMDEDSGTP